jgi:hypothetical protein
MSLPNVSYFKPLLTKWGVTDAEWECTILRMFRDDTYVREYNGFVVQSVKANVLGAIVPPVILSTRKARAKGRWVQKPGISLTDDRPNYFRSLATYGDLFFETPLGHHKEFKPVKGRGAGYAGQFIILWECDSYLSHGKHPRCADVSAHMFFNSLATAYALIEEAQSRGDHVTLLVAPGEVDTMTYAHSKPANRRAPKVPVTYVAPSDKVQRKIEWSSNMNRFVGNTFEISAVAGKVYELNIPGITDYSWADPWLEPIGGGQQHAKAPRFKVGDTVRVKAGAHRDFIDDSDYTYKLDDVFSDGFIMPGIWTWPHEYAPEGQFTEEWLRIRAEAFHHITLKKNYSHPNLSKYYFWRDSTDYDEILNELLELYWAGHSEFAWTMIPIAAVEAIMKGVPTLDKRGSFILLTAFQNMEWFWPAYQYLRRLSKKYDVYIMDVGEHDWSLVFRREDTFKLNGKPYIKYMNISNLVNITISQFGMSTFSELDVNVERVAQGNVVLETKTTINLNDGDRIKTYSSNDYPTIADLVKAIQTDFKELHVERLTVAKYKTKELVEVHRNFSFADGIAVLTGYDVENFTYKLLKVMGGKINGVSVV